MDQTILLLGLCGLSSISAYFAGVKGFGLTGCSLRVATGKMLECIGLTLLFFVANLVVGIISVLTVRRLTGGFVSIYLLNDVALLVMSLLQGLTFHCWRELSEAPTGDP